MAGFDRWRMGELLKDAGWKEKVDEQATTRSVYVPPQQVIDGLLARGLQPHEALDLHRVITGVDLESAEE